MNISEGFRESWDTVRHNKLRTFLTMLGMNIGVAAVIAIMASGLMARTAIMSGVENIGAALMWVRPNNNAYIEGQERTRLQPRDIEAMRSLTDGVSFSPLLRTNWTVSYRGFADVNSIYGITPDYRMIWKPEVSRGRFINLKDQTEKVKTAVLGTDAADVFFPTGEDPLGKQITIESRIFTVAGVLAEKERSFIGNGTDDSTIFIPYSVSENMYNWDWFGGTPRVFSLNILAENIDKLEETAEILERYLLSRYGKINGEPRFILRKAEDNIETFNNIFGVITTVISLIAAISLLVSGIGIMNIMLVTVTERTKEIGIRKAVGARRADILIQFIIEAVIICLIGGGIGIFIGLGIAFAVAALQKWQYVMPLFAVTLGIGVSAAIGLFFGIYPAMKASRLDPVLALTKE